MKKNKKIVIIMTMLFNMILFSTSIIAAPIANSSDNNIIVVIESNITSDLQYVTEEEMEAAIRATQDPKSTRVNLFDDCILFTITDNGDGSARAVFLNVGFPLDMCDVTGKIYLYNGSLVVASHTVYEPKLMYGVARVRNITAAGFYFTEARFDLTPSDNGVLGPSVKGSIYFD